MSKECDICHYWYFLDKGFKFQRYICNECHDVLMISINLNDIAISNMNGANDLCIINRISKSDTLNLLQIFWLDKKRSIIKTKKNYKKFIIIYKMRKNVYNSVSFGKKVFKYLIGNEDGENVSPSWVMLPKMNT